MRDGNVDPASESQIELIRSATGIACVQLWARVVLQLLADIDTGLRAIRAGPATNLDAAASRQQVVKDARAAAAWLFGPAAEGYLARARGCIRHSADDAKTPDINLVVRLKGAIKLHPRMMSK